MKQINTKSDLKGRTFYALRLIKGLAIEDIPLLRKDITEQIEAQGGTVTENETSFCFGCQVFMKPVQKREVKGKLICGASYATFNNSRIEYKDMTIHPGMSSFDTKNASFAIHSEL
jgi:hypothetical protein